MRMHACAAASPLSWPSLVVLDLAVVTTKEEKLRNAKEEGPEALEVAIALGKDLTAIPPRAQASTGRASFG